MPPPICTQHWSVAALQVVAPHGMVPDVPPSMRPPLDGPPPLLLPCAPPLEPLLPSEPPLLLEPLAPLPPEPPLFDPPPELPALEPPVLEPPVLEPPVLEPPVLEPPVLEPPALEPPVLEPPALEPPVLEPAPLEEPVMDPLEEDPVTTAVPRLPPLGLSSRVVLEPQPKASSTPSSANTNQAPVVIRELAPAISLGPFTRRQSSTRVRRTMFATRL